MAANLEWQQKYLASKIFDVKNLIVSSIFPDDEHFTSYNYQKKEVWQFLKKSVYISYYIVRLFLNLSWEKAIDENDIIILFQKVLPL